LLDFSQRNELSLHAEVAAAVVSALEATAIAGIVVGAFARDLHLNYGAGVPVQRGTEDIDFAFLVHTWQEFEALRGRMLEAGSFRAMEGSKHRLEHGNGIKVDLVPFGAIETKERQIEWPPNGDFIMDVFGFREALSTADTVLLPRNVTIKIVSLPALALLKFVAWHDRHRRAPGKDAADLNLILRNYLAPASNQRRLWVDFVAWTESDDFDYELSGARMLAHDVRNLLDPAGLARIVDILRSQIDDDDLGELPQEMNRLSPELAHALLRTVCDELQKVKSTPPPDL
jgi:predicted nucleotidyltransferase